MSVKIQKILLRNTATNYINLVWQMVTALFITRFMFLGLGEHLYGYWALLWTIFGYSLLLDFGFGTSVQKYSAELTVTKDYDKFNNLISAVITSYGLMSVIIIAATLLGVYWFESFFPNVEPEKLEYYKNIFLCFGIGTGLCFPSGIMPEILHGLMRADLKNYVNLGVHTLNILGVYFILEWGYSLLVLTVFTLSLNLFANVVMFVIIKRIVPEVSLSISKVKMKYIKEISSFSFYAYVFTIATMIIFRTDKIVLNFMLTMGAITIYHIGTRVPEIMEKLTGQFQSNLTPIAASLYKEGNTEKLNRILLKSNRLAAFLAVGSFAIFYFLASPILYVWLDVTDETATLITQIMLVSVFVSVMFRSASFRFLQMAGKHKILTLIVGVEAIVNILLSISLVGKYGVVGVAVGTLVPNVIISLLIVFPMFCKFSSTSILGYLKKVYIPVLITSLPTVALLFFIKREMVLADWSLFRLIVAVGLSGVVYLVSAYFIFLESDEKNGLLTKMPFGNR